MSRDLAQDANQCTEAGFMIRLKLPPGMSTRQAQDELRTAVSFGQPEITLQYVTSGQAGDFRHLAGSAGYDGVLGGHDA